MALPRSLRQYASKRFNVQAGFWYFTKASIYVVSPFR